jgi:hypothetical protein
MFIEKISEKEVRNYLEKAKPHKKILSIEFMDKEKYGNVPTNYWYCVIADDHENFEHINLYDFGSNMYNTIESWIKFLYNIFGEEYKNLYLQSVWNNIVV